MNNQAIADTMIACLNARRRSHAVDSEYESTLDRRCTESVGHPVAM